MEILAQCHSFYGKELVAVSSAQRDAWGDGSGTPATPNQPWQPGNQGPAGTSLKLQSPKTLQERMKDLELDIAGGWWISQFILYVWVLFAKVGVVLGRVLDIPSALRRRWWFELPFRQLRRETFTKLLERGPNHTLRWGICLPWCFVFFATCSFRSSQRFSIRPKKQRKMRLLRIASCNPGSEAPLRSVPLAPSARAAIGNARWADVQPVGSLATWRPLVCVPIVTIVLHTLANLQFCFQNSMGMEQT